MTHVKIHYTLNYNKEVAYEKNQFNLLIIAIWLCAFYSKLCRPRHRYKRGGIAGYGPGYDPNDPIDAKYPYWRVTIKDFGCSNGTTCTWTVDEKKAAIKMMARLRAMLNIPEFQDVFRQNAPYIADEVESYEGSPYSTTTGEAYDTERLLWSILNADFEVTYRKQDNVGGDASANVGKSLYVQLGYNPDVYKFDYVCNFPNTTYTGTGNSGYVSHTSLVFHEHLHNMGMTHAHGKDPVTDIQMVLFNWWYNGNLKDPKLETSHQAQINEITNYYLEKYAHLLESDTSN